MWNLLAPFLGSLVSGGFGLIGANQASASSARAARLNAILQAQQNAQNTQLQLENNAQSRRMAWNMMRFQSKKAGQMFKKQIAEANVDRALQKEFAQQGVKWRVDDAKAAGIHPLAALGAQLATSSPISIQGHVASGSVPNQIAPQGSAPQPFVGDANFGNALSSMGQDLSRAIAATSTQNERDDQYQRASRTLSLENQALQNKLLSAQIARTRGAGLGPAFPGGRRLIVDGQGNAPSIMRTGGSLAGVRVEPSETTTKIPGAPYAEPGIVPEIQYGNTSSGGFTPEMGAKFKDLAEDSIFSEFPWFVRNRLLPTFGLNLSPPPHVPLKADHHWVYNPVTQDYHQAPNRLRKMFSPYQGPGSTVPYPDRAM